MRLTAKRGRGYTPADANKSEDQPIGVIPIDSIYTPVSRVTYQVEKTRVGQVAIMISLRLMYGRMEASGQKKLSL